MVVVLLHHLAHQHVKLKILTQYEGNVGVTDAGAGSHQKSLPEKLNAMDVHGFQSGV